MIDGTVILLTSIALVYLIAKNRIKNLSWPIVIQISLVWLISLLFSIRNVWMVANGDYILDKDSDAWVIYDEIFALNIFWL